MSDHKAEKGNRGAMLRTSFTLMMMLVRALPFVGGATVLNMVVSGLLPSVGVVVLERTTDQAKQVAESNSAVMLLVWLALLVAVQAGQSLTLQLHIWLNSISQDEFRRHLQRRLMEKSERLQLEYFEQPTFFDLLQRARASIASGDFYMMMMRVAENFSSVLTLSSIAAILIYYDARLFAAVALTGVPILVSRFVESRSRYALHKEEAQNQRLADYLIRLQTDRAAAKELRLFQISGYLREKWSRVASSLAEARVRVARRASVRNAVADSGSQIGFVAALLLGVWLTVQGSLAVSTFVALVEALRRFQGALTHLLAQTGLQYEYVLRFSDLLRFLQLPHEERREAKPVTGPIKAGIAVERVSFQYPGHHTKALNDVTFTIHPGESVAFVGPNGAGKSTMVRLILGLYQPTEGEIYIDGVSLKTISPDSLREHSSAVFQDFVRYHLTLRDNIGFGKLSSLHDDVAIDTAARRGGASVVLERLGGDLDTMLGKEFSDGTDLSGGEWQRVAIARSFMRSVPLVVLDEPTASLDPLMEADIFRRFAALSEESTTILVSHRLGSARLADRIFVFDDGRLIEQGTHSDLLARNGFYARMWAEQAEWYRRGVG